MFKIDLKSLYSLSAKLIISAVLFLVPVFFVYFYPLDIDLSKMVLFKWLLLLLLLITGLFLINYRITIKQGVFKSFKPLILLFIFLIVSLFFSSDFNVSWFGSYGRFEGLTSWFFYLLWMLLTWVYLETNPGQKWHNIIYFLKVATLSSLLVSVYAVLQIFGVDFVTWSEPAHLTGRAVSFFGQPNYLASWLMLIIPVNTYLIYQTSKIKLKFFWLFVFILNLAALLSAGSRAVFLVFLLISFIWLISFLKKTNKLSKKNIYLIISTFFILGVLFLSSLAFSNYSRFEELINLKKGSASDRFILWKSGFSAFLEKPLFGYGLDNQSQAYFSKYEIDWAVYSPPNVYSDRAHNLILDILLSVGILGLGFFIYFYYWVFKNLRIASKDLSNNCLPYFLSWSLLLYLAALMFNFSVTVTSVYFWFYLALSISLVKQFSINYSEKKNKHFLLSLFLIISLLSFVGLATLKEFRRLEANYYYQEFLKSSSASEDFVALVFKDYLDDVWLSRTEADFYNRQTSLVLISKLLEGNDPVLRKALSDYLTIKVDSFFSNSFENKLVRAFSLAVAGKKYESFTLFEELSLTSKEMPKIFLAWGDSLMLSQNYSLAAEKFDQALKLLPDTNNYDLGAKQKNDIISYRGYLQGRLDAAKSLVN